MNYIAMMRLKLIHLWMIKVISLMVDMQWSLIY